MQLTKVPTPEMPKIRSLHLTLIGAVFCIFSVQIIATAGDNPWSENAIKTHINRADLSGSLSTDEMQALAKRGEELFAAKFTSLDGAGRPLATQAIIPTKRKHPPQQVFDRISGPDANSCASCHNEPKIGGAGSFTVNVFASEGFTGQGSDSTHPPIFKRAKYQSYFRGGTD